MAVLNAPKIEMIAQAKDPKQALIDAVGDLSGEDVFNDLVLVATYIRPEKTAGGIIRPHDNIKEDEHQSKVGLVLKTGPTAFFPDEEIQGDNAKLHTWVVFQAANTWKLQLNGVACSLLPYERIKMRTNNPSAVF